MPMWKLAAFVFSALHVVVQAAVKFSAISQASAPDEASFVSRPDLKPVVPVIQTYHPHLVSPGYHFHSPFERTTYGADKHRVYIPGQFGPHIYDEHGELVWSGALEFNQSEVFDFRKTRYRGSDALSLILCGNAADKNTWAVCTGVVLDSSYEIVKKVNASNGQEYINMHEFNLINEGTTALVITSKFRNISRPDDEFFRGLNISRVWDYGFQEVQVDTDKTIFEWWAYDHIRPSDTHYKVDGYSDIYHMNSVDKTRDGDYLISVRHTSAIYLISGRNGSIMWQLGGNRTDFVHADNLDFGGQHSARVYSQNDTHLVLSFLDNAADDIITMGNCSSALLVALSTSSDPMVAHVLRKWDRPDLGHTKQRGNIQMLQQGNAFVSWADFGYTSEFTSNGTLVQEVRSSLERFSEYRQYKFEWQAAEHLPEPIAISSQSYGTAEDAMMTIIHVSWNGATQVASWNFYASETDEFTSQAALVKTTKKHGFETIAVVHGHHPFIFAEAVTQEGKKLQHSDAAQTKLPPPYTYASNNKDLASNTGGISPSGSEFPVFSGSIHGARHGDWLPLVMSAALGFAASVSLYYLLRIGHYLRKESHDV